MSHFKMIPFSRMIHSIGLDKLAIMVFNRSQNKNNKNWLEKKLWKEESHTLLKKTKMFKK